MSEEYDLKGSEKVGQLYPVLVDADGNVIDGFHRLDADPNWRKEKLENIDSEEKLLLARCISNWHRRKVSREEKEEWINGLAKIYKKQGLTVKGKRKGSAGRAPNEIRDKIAEITGLHHDTVHAYLNSRYKQETPKDVVPIPRVPASQVIETQFEHHKEGYGRQLVERHREEVKEELKHDRDFQREIIKEIRKPKIVKPTEACPSGVCELPPVVETGDPLDVRAEAITDFFKQHPDCKCKGCKNYGKCGVIY